jgi:hypothetical protein
MSRDGITVNGYLPPRVISALRAPSAKELTRLTDLVVLVRGSRPKIPQHRQQLAP